jgi:uncharacterized membrane protein YuzA (DUF378 family)
MNRPKLLLLVLGALFGTLMGTIHANIAAQVGGGNRTQTQG